MNIPKLLKIGAHTYTVHLVTPPTLSADESPSGINSNQRGIIEIDARLIDTEKGVTLFHEILHVMNSELDHVVLDSLAQQLYQVLHDNNLLK